jgi:hypothetical protein
MRQLPLWFSVIAFALILPALAGAPAAAKVVGPPDVAWAKMTYTQRKQYMNKVVTPAMKKVFQEFDAEKFKSFDCQTCHGKDAQQRKYKMPSNDIHPLPGTPAGFQAALKKEPTWPKWAKFMSEKVVPEMGRLLNLPVFNPKQPVEGAFSCGACHKLEKS